MDTNGSVTAQLYERPKSRLRVICSRLAAKAGVRFFDLTYGELDITDWESDFGPPPPRFQIRFLTAEETKSYLGGLSGVHRIDCLAAIEVCSRLMAVLSDNKVVGRIWCNRDAMPLADTMARLPEGTVCTHGGFVEPEYRGQGLLSHLTMAVIGWMQHDDLRFIAHLADVSNRASIVSRRRLGFSYQSCRVLVLPGTPPIMLTRPIMAGRHPMRLISAV